MAHPIIDKIVNEGVDSVNVSMLSKELRFHLMTEAGNILLHKDRPEEAAKAFAIAGNHDLLNEYGRWFMTQQKPGTAAFFLLHVEKEDLLEDLAKECIATNNIRSAMAVYEKLGNTTMISFLKENFAA